MRRLFAWIAAIALAALSPPFAVAQPAPAAPQAAEPLKARIAQLPALLAGTADYDDFFSPEFRAAISRDRFDDINKQLSAAGGPITGVEQITPLSPWSAAVVLGYRYGRVTLQIGVDSSSPHRVSGLAVTGFTAREATMAAVAASLRALPGQTGFAYAELGDAAPRLLVTEQPGQPLAIGSTFKLVILAELVRATNAGERRWDDKVTIDGRPLPGGAYTLIPAGTQIPLREVADKMISISDNSATDILLQLVGRKRVEAMLPVVGIAKPAALRPFMGALEMFKLKGVPGLATRYLALDEAGRRGLLDGEIAALPLSAIAPTLFLDGKPVLIDRLEWFESPSDLVRVMDWLRRNTASGPGAEARAILGLNPGVAHPNQWRYIGYKGGSEPGVISMTLLLEGKDGVWRVITGTWNNPAAAVDETRLAVLMGRAAELAAP